MSRHNLPTFPTPFIGRTAEITELSQLLDNPDCRLLTLVGPGGIGKTRLAVEVARCVQGDFPEGVYFVPLQPLQAADQVLSAIIDVFQLQFTGDAHRGLLSYLSEKRLLLILDNFEHVLNAVELVSQILMQAHAVKLLVTSRENLNLRGEWVRQVAGLTYPDAGNSDSVNHQYTAIELFNDCAKRLRSDFSSKREYDYILRISQYVGGMPLALELAAGWLTLLTPAQIADQLQQNLDLLVTHTRDIPSRHRSIRAVFDHSWHLLAGSEQAVCRKLTVFQGSFDIEAAQNVAGATLEIMANLASKSLVKVDETGRYSLHELLREYAEERLIVAGERESTQQAHCSYFMNFLQQREPNIKGGRQFEVYREIDHDFDNIRAAWHYAVEQRDYDALDRGMECLYRYETNQHMSVLDDELFGQVAQRLLELNSGVANATWGRIIARAYSHDSGEKWIPDIEIALDLAQQRNDVGEIGHCYHMLGVIACENDRLFDALRWHEQGLEYFQQFGDPFYVADAFVQIAGCYDLSGDFNKGQEFGNQSLAIRREIKDYIGVVWCLLSVAGISLWLGDYNAAREMLLEALELLQSNDTGGQELLLSRVKAIVYYAVCTCLGFISLLQGDAVDVEYYRQIVDPGKVSQSELVGRYVPISLVGISAVLKGDFETGERLLGWIHAGLQNMFWLDPTIAEWGLAIVHVSLGDDVQAQEHLTELMQDSLKKKRIMPLTLALPMQAQIMANKREIKRAAELLGLAFTHPKSATGWMEKWPLLSRLRAQLEAELGIDAYAYAWERGSKMDLMDVADQFLADLDGDYQSTRESANLKLTEPLTERELEVLALVAAGDSNRQMAEALVITVGTVKRYVYDICQKLDTQNRTHAVARARELGLL